MAEQNSVFVHEFLVFRNSVSVFANPLKISGLVQISDRFYLHAVIQVG
jgi:hypothetical protein